jgi:hypothetical protein
MADIARFVATDVTPPVIADSGHWLMEERPAATVAGHGPPRVRQMPALNVPPWKPQISSAVGRRPGSSRPAHPATIEISNSQTA